MLSPIVLVFTSSSLLALVWMLSSRRSVSVGMLFEYPSLIKWILGVGVVGGIGLCVHILPPLYPRGLVEPLDWLYVGLIALFFLWLTCAFLYVTTYKIYVTTSDLNVRAFAILKSIEFKNISRVDVIQGNRAVQMLLFNQKGKQIFGVGSTISNFNGLLLVVMRRVAEAGGTIRRRTVMGKWSVESQK